MVYHKMSKTEFENFWAWQMEAMQKKENLEFGPLDYYLLEIFEDAPFFLFRDYYLFVCYFSWTLLCVCKQQTGVDVVVRRCIHACAMATMATSRIFERLRESIRNIIKIPYVSQLLSQY